MFYEMGGNTEKEIDNLRAITPVFLDDKIKAPLLIAQSVNNERVNVNETNQFVKELKKRNVPVTYIAKENNGYNFRNSETRIEYYNALEKFFATNLKR